MSDLTARRLELLNARFVGKRVADKRNGQTGTITQAHLYQHWGRMGWTNGLHLVVKMDGCWGTWIARFGDASLKFL